MLEIFRRGHQALCVDDPVEARAIWYVRRGRVRSCVRPMLRGPLGPLALMQSAAWLPKMCRRPRRSKGDLVCAPRSGAVMCPAYVARPFRTAGPDAIRSLAPKQIYALEW